MRIALICPYADPEKGAAVVRINSFRDDFTKAGHTVLILSPERGAGSAQGVVRYRGTIHLLSLLRWHAPAVVIGTSPPITHNFFAAVFCRLRGIPFVLDSKDPFSYLVSRFAHLKKGRLKTVLYKFFDFSTHRLASRIFVLTPRDKANIQKWYSLQAEKVAVVWNGSAPEVVRRDGKARARTRKELSIPPSSKVVLYAGVIGGKELDTLLVVCRPVLEKADVRLLFLLTHDGSAHAERMHSMIRQAIRSLGLEQRTHTVLNIPYSQLYKYFSAADIALSPVPEFWETCLPTKVFDYLAAELPVVAKGPVPGSMHDFFQQHDTGYFARDWEGFARALEKALSDRALRSKGRTGRAVIKKEFSRARSNRTALAILEQLAGRKP